MPPHRDAGQAPQVRHDRQKLADRYIFGRNPGQKKFNTERLFFFAVLSTAKEINFPLHYSKLERSGW